ncbi:hypothetical protein ASPWEDRAFT_43320 [Aspergillus wentii DTO 134E9]|uniref:Uncharacterized protein n=1 Tax=Aspergillus wentii DTO 134E9 TaxID=1073089 RepID=A0A1L9RE97_ASPWE|nr:uncharacterized protein ASPWEDRAFT_43320 [Aspergillus wentii DTO 134E9]OJJ33241.1 hypothetical protein ASPWEDRAFT_43320 [Aspergillus wentii DTO 134E9]
MSPAMDKTLVVLLAKISGVCQTKVHCPSLIAAYRQKKPHNPPEAQLIRPDRDITKDSHRATIRIAGRVCQTASEMATKTACKDKDPR